MEEIHKFIKQKNENPNPQKNEKSKFININIEIFKVIFVLSFYLCIFLKKLYNSKKVKKSIYDDMIPRLSIMNKNFVPNISKLFYSRQLFINDINLTLDYIHYIRPINETTEEKYKQELYPNLVPDLSFTKNRNNQIDLYTYYKLCNEEKLISDETIEYPNNPLISVLIPSYNNADIILKSVRSIQNQSLKNIEIIIVNDGSTDNSSYIFDYLLRTDPRIRIFNHLKNMGAWRSRLDAFLYSKAPYVIHFDSGDFYTDNLVLEDAYRLITRYKLDSVRFSFKLSRSKENIDFKSWNFSFPKRDRKIVYGRRSYSMLLFAYGPIWNRLTRANIFTKGLDYLDEYILNAYKNLYEDRWWNTIANNASYSYLMVNRIGYIYLRIPGGAGVIRYGNPILNEKLIKEYVYFWIFDYLLLYKKDNKKNIIDKLHHFNEKEKKYGLNDLKSYFKPYIYLLDLLINDTYVEKEDKEFVKCLKINYTKNFENKNEG